MPASPVYHFSATSSAPEDWLPIHSRRLQVQTLHHDALSVHDDGRIAFCTGSVLNVFHPPLQPPLYSALKSALRRVYIVNRKPNDCRKDTVSTANLLSALIWVDTAILVKNGAGFLTMLRLPQRPDNNLRFALDSSYLWHPTPLSLLPPPSERLPTDMSSSTNRLRYITFARISYLEDENDANSALCFTSFIVCATESATDLYPIDVNAPPSTFSRPISSAFRLHDRCTITASCIDGIQTAQGLRTLVALSDETPQITVYAVRLLRSNPVTLESTRLWNSAQCLPPSPIVSLSWSLHSARNSFITLATTSGNDVVIIDWGYSSQISVDAPTWNAPRIHCVVDAHEQLVTSVQVCHDGCVVSAGMDGRVICWRININAMQIEPTQADSPMPAFAAVLQERGDRCEPVMALKRTCNAFAIVVVNSTMYTHHVTDSGETESCLKSSSSAPDTLVRLLVIPPYGTAEDVEKSMVSHTRRLMSDPSLLDRPMMSWDASHVIHYFSDCADAVVPKLVNHLTDMTKQLECAEERVAQRFIQRARALLWLCRVMDHPHCENSSVDGRIKDIFRRLSNSLLYMHYMLSLRKLLAMKCDLSECSRNELASIENMCEFVLAWDAKGWGGGADDLRCVEEVKGRALKVGKKGGEFSMKCPVCRCEDKPSVLMACDTDAGCMRCAENHVFQRCVSTGLIVDECVALECCGCKAQGIVYAPGEFEWLWAERVCALCKGGMIDSQCEVH